MAQIGILSPKKQLAITALLTAPNIREAAKIAGVGYRTLQTWLKDEQFRTALSLAESDLVSDAIRELTGEMRANIRLLKWIRDDDYQAASERRRAAVSLDEMLFRWRHHFTIEQRLSNLESVLLGGEQE